MPTAPPSRCNCGRKATRHGRCPQHQPKPWANPSANTRNLTGAQRARIKRDQLAREPQCRACGTTDNLEPDHIIPIAEGGALHDPTNLQTLCATHHAQKTALDRRRGQTRSQQRRGGASQS